ncbi:hypothetical protein MTO96_004706 [Rhipicephalus appendiculatus]
MRARSYGTIKQAKSAEPRQLALPSLRILLNVAGPVSNFATVTKPWLAGPGAPTGTNVVSSARSILSIACPASRVPCGTQRGSTWLTSGSIRPFLLSFPLSAHSSRSLLPPGNKLRKVERHEREDRGKAGGSCCH